MGENSKIQWCTHTLNLWIGCHVLTEECDHCYARRGSARLGAQHGLKLWDGDRYVTTGAWKSLAKWQRAAAAAGRIDRVFVNSYSDIGDDHPAVVEARARLAGLIPTCDSLIFQLLTKRPENLVRLFEPYWGTKQWPKNVWAGTTVGVRASIPRIAALRQVPAGVRFLSCEPLLEDLGELDLSGIAWLISGGESGASARPFAFKWAERLQAQCKRKGVAYFFKQAGDHATWNGELVKLRTKKGGEPSEWPTGFAARREFPQ